MEKEMTRGEEVSGWNLDKGREGSRQGRKKKEKGI
jgi:hypothetical protein